MNALRTTLLAAALVAVAGCHPDTPAAAPTSAAGEHTLGDHVAGNIENAMKEADDKLASQNITVRSDDGNGSSSAEITPDGRLFIDHKEVALNAAQRAAVLDYRRQTLDIAHAGIAVGMQGAKMATKAVTEAIGGLFSGHPEDIEKRVEAQSGDIKKAASALCDRLPALYAAQRNVVAAVPEFAPFAKSTSVDVAGCKHDMEDDVAPAAEAAATASPR